MLVELTSGKTIVTETGDIIHRKVHISIKIYEKTKYPLGDL
jgi:hypothetical protein